jgi:hypothetical protein
VLDARRSRSEATTAGLASAAVPGRSTVGMRSRNRPMSASVAVPAGAGGSAPAGPTAVRGRRAGRRRTGRQANRPPRAARLRAVRLDGPVPDFLRRISAHSATPTNSRPASRTGARLRNPARRQPAPGRRSTDAAEESSTGAHTPRRCALCHHAASQYLGLSSSRSRRPVKLRGGPTKRGPVLPRRTISDHQRGAGRIANAPTPVVTYRDSRKIRSPRALLVGQCLDYLESRGPLRREDCRDHAEDNRGDRDRDHDRAGEVEAHSRHHLVDAA